MPPPSRLPGRRQHLILAPEDTSYPRLYKPTSPSAGLILQAFPRICHSLIGLLTELLARPLPEGGGVCNLTLATAPPPLGEDPVASAHPQVQV